MTTLSNIALSVLDLAPVRDDATYADAFARTVALAQHAESLGFTRFWLAEHHNMDGIGSSATSVLIGHIAGKTSRIRVGSGGVMLPNHAPLVIAEHFGTLATLYPNRIDLGLGRAPGSDGLTMRALRREHTDHADRFPEQVAELQFYLGDGEEGQRVHAIPGRGTHVPIWLLGSSLYSAQLAGQRGLPYSFAAHFAPRLLKEAVEVYRANFIPSASLAKPYVSIGVALCVAPTDAEAEYLHTTAQQSILALVRGQSLRQKPPVDSMHGRWTPAERSYVEEFHQRAVVGSPTRAHQQLLELAALTACDEFIFTGNFYQAEHQQRSLGLVKQVCEQH